MVVAAGAPRAIAIASRWCPRRPPPLEIFKPPIFSARSLGVGSGDLPFCFFLGCCELEPDRLRFCGSIDIETGKASGMLIMDDSRMSLEYFLERFGGGSIDIGTTSGTSMIELSRMSLEYFLERFGGAGAGATRFRLPPGRYVGSRRLAAIVGCRRDGVFDGETVLVRRERNRTFRHILTTQRKNSKVPQ
jgi:hypothetical protein